MKGLLKKDILLAVKTYKFILIVCIVLFAVRFFAEEVSVAVLLPVMFAGMLPTSLLAVDERDGWDRTAEMLPVTRAQRVGAKFLLGFLFWAVMAALSVLVEAGASLVQGNFDGSALLTMAALFAVAGLACPAVTLTFGFRFGTEKARYLYFLLMAVIFAAGAALFLFPPEGFSFPWWGSVLTLLGAVAAYGLLYLLSAVLYKKRELT